MATLRKISRDLNELRQRLNGTVRASAIRLEQSARGSEIVIRKWFDPCASESEADDQLNEIERHAIAFLGAAVRRPDILAAKSYAKSGMVEEMSIHFALRTNATIVNGDQDWLPSEVVDQYWLHARRKIGAYPDPTVRSGKWLIFAPIGQIDELWAKIKRATEEGLLGDSAKVATARPKPNRGDNSRKVICVYTYDWQDDADRSRVRQQLRHLGVTWKIGYKSDQDTLNGKYGRSVWKFFE